ncbi:START-like domain superfamily [Sesbania bispinosa]|nr:START-like domain superfamily [Sesbania bispinosa]
MVIAKAGGRARLAVQPQRLPDGGAPLRWLDLRRGPLTVRLRQWTVAVLGAAGGCSGAWFVAAFHCGSGTCSPWYASVSVRGVTKVMGDEARGSGSGMRQGLNGAHVNGRELYLGVNMFLLRRQTQNQQENGSSYQDAKGVTKVVGDEARGSGSGMRQGLNGAHVQPHNKGRALLNAIYNLELTGPYGEALSKLGYKIEDVAYQASDRELHFSMVDGDFNKFKGKWSVKSGTRSSSTNLSFEVNVIPRFNFPFIFFERIIGSDLPVNLQALAYKVENHVLGNQKPPLTENQLHKPSTAINGSSVKKINGAV